jgi:type II secretory pathway component GspD/PulD (secretin)
VAELEKIDVPMNNLVVETVNLRFLEAANLATVLNKMVTPYGSIATNEVSNSVIICDTQESVRRILEEVNRADKTPSQIMIEVVLLDVKLGNDTEIGVNWDLLSENLYDVSFRQSFSGTGGRLSMLPNDTTAFDGEFYNATRYNTQGYGGDFSLISGTIRHVLHMLQEKKDVEIVASPRALVVSGRTAQIKAVEEIPYTETSDTSNGGQLTSTKFKDVGVTLEVTPILTDQNEIFLNVNTEHNVQTGESTDGIPIVDTRSETTFLLIKDGQMGGLRRREKTMQVQQIPLLGDLPIVGFLFRKTHDVINNTELVVLLAPHIYRSEPVPLDIMNSVDTIRKGALTHSAMNEAPVESKVKTD